MGLNAEAHITSLTMRLVEPTFNPMMNVGDPQIDMEQETVQYHGQSIALTFGQGIPDYIDTPLEQYDSIAHNVQHWPRDNTQTQTSLC